MAARRIKKYKPFSSLSRKKRGTAGLRLRREIEATQNYYGGMFTSDLTLDASPETQDKSQWFDFLFLGKDKCNIWNATISTASMAFWDEVKQIAMDETIALLSPEEWEQETSYEFIPAECSQSGKVLTYQVRDKEVVYYPQLNDLTFSQYCQQLEQEIINTRPPLIYESFTTDYSYRYGIGLDIIVDAAEISQAVIEDAISRFIILGEVDWKAEQPVPRERLPHKAEAKLYGQALPVRLTGNGHTKEA